MSKKVIIRFKDGTEKIETVKELERADMFKYYCESLEHMRIGNIMFKVEDVLFLLYVEE